MNTQMKVNPRCADAIFRTKEKSSPMTENSKAEISPRNIYPKKGKFLTYLS